MTIISTDSHSTYPKQPSNNISDKPYKCSKCGEFKPADLAHFEKDNRRPFGLRASCRVCKQKLYKPDARKLFRIENKKRLNKVSADYYRKNKKRLRQQQTEYRKTDAFKAHILKQKAKPEVHMLNAFRTRIRGIAQRATATKSAESISFMEWQFAQEYFYYSCAACGRQFTNLFGEHTVSMDHWKPLSKGGESTASNIIPLCHGINGCNNKKHNKLPEQWLVEEFGKRKAKKILERINAYFAIVSNRDIAA